MKYIALLIPLFYISCAFTMEEKYIAAQINNATHSPITVHISSKISSIQDDRVFSIQPQKATGFIFSPEQEIAEMIFPLETGAWTIPFAISKEKQQELNKFTVTIQTLETFLSIAGPNGRLNIKPYYNHGTIGSPLNVEPTIYLQLPILTFCNENLFQVGLVCQFFAHLKRISSYLQHLEKGIEATYNMSQRDSSPIITSALLKLLIPQACKQITLNIDKNVIQSGDRISLIKIDDKIFIKRQRTSEPDVDLLPEPLNCYYEKNPTIAYNL